MILFNLLYNVPLTVQLVSLLFMYLEFAYVLWFPLYTHIGLLTSVGLLTHKFTIDHSRQCSGCYFHEFGIHACVMLHLSNNVCYHLWNTKMHRPIGIARGGHGRAFTLPSLNFAVS